jgi:hypothetical protein
MDGFIKTIQDSTAYAVYQAESEKATTFKNTNKYSMMMFVIFATLSLISSLVNSIFLILHYNNINKNTEDILKLGTAIVNLILIFAIIVTLIFAKLHYKQHKFNTDIMIAKILFIVIIILSITNSGLLIDLYIKSDNQDDKNKIILGGIYFGLLVLLILIILYSWRKAPVTFASIMYISRNFF